MNLQMKQLAFVLLCITTAGAVMAATPTTTPPITKPGVGTTADMPAHPPAKSTGETIRGPATLTGISQSNSTAPAGKLLLNVTGTGLCKFHLTYMKNEPPLVATPLLTFTSSPPKKFPMTLEMPMPALHGTYTYKVYGVDNCVGNKSTTITVK